MPPKGTTGIKNRNFPPVSLKQAMSVPTAIQESAAGMEVDRLTLGDLLGRSPGSRIFTDLLLGSRSFGLTNGGVNADIFSLTDLGNRATEGDEAQRITALREAVLTVPPFRSFLQAHSGKRLPAPAAMKAFLIAKASVPESRAEECAQAIIDNSREVGFIRKDVRGGEWIEILSTSPGTRATPNDSADEHGEDYETQPDIQDEYDNDAPPSTSLLSRDGNGRGQESIPADRGVFPPAKPRHVFVGHGKNRKPLEQLKAMLDQFGISAKIAVDEPNAGRPVGEKVATIMRDECSSAIFILSADEQFFLKKAEDEFTEIWRPSENAVYELGAAAVLYGRRIILFKEDRVTLPSDFRELTYIGYSGDDIHSHWAELLRELKAQNMIQITVTG